MTTANDSGCAWICAEMSSEIMLSGDSALEKTKTTKTVPGLRAVSTWFSSMSRCAGALHEQSLSRFQGHWDEIRERMLDLMCNDPRFINAIEMKTSGRDQMNTRFKKWFDILDSILAGSPPNPRIFPYAIKEQLFSDDPTCKLCGNRIMAIEDAEVDHIDPYNKGGPATIENAQIAHRYCNRHKGDKPA